MEEKTTVKLSYLFNSKKNDGLTKAQVKTVKNILNDAGIKHDFDDYYKYSDTVFYYEYVNIFIMSKGKYKVEVIPVGDIRIYDKKNPDIYFKYEGGKPATGINDDITKDLVKNGRYQANNWFELDVYKKNKYGKYEYYDIGDDNIAISLEDAIVRSVEVLFEKNKKFNAANKGD